MRMAARFSPFHPQIRPRVRTELLIGSRGPQKNPRRRCGTAEGRGVRGCAPQKTLALGHKKIRDAAVERPKAEGCGDVPRKRKLARGPQEKSETPLWNGRRPRGAGMCPEKNVGPGPQKNPRHHLERPKAEGCGDVPRKRKLALGPQKNPRHHLERPKAEGCGDVPRKRKLALGPQKNPRLVSDFSCGP